MKADRKYRSKPKSFWASVRSLSQEIGYSERGTGKILVPDFQRMARAFSSLGLDPNQILVDGQPTYLAQELRDYFSLRAKLLAACAEPNLMNQDQAKALFLKLKSELSPTCPLPMNKQKGDKRAEAYLT